jgi:hypothetical protein
MYATDADAVRADRLRRHADRLRVLAARRSPARAHAYSSWADELERRALELRTGRALEPVTRASA